MATSIPAVESWKSERINECKAILDRLCASTKIPFDSEMRSALPNEHGLYMITQKTALSGAILRAGRTKTGHGGLQQRIYQNHLMGNQQGNLRAQLVRDGICSDQNSAKEWVKTNCVVQFVIVEEPGLRAWAEHFMLSVLRPKYCD